MAKLGLQYQFRQTKLCLMDKLSAFIRDYGGAALADQLGVTPGAVSSWRHGRYRVPGVRCRDIERLSGGRVTVHDLRPDIFGPAPTAPREAA